MTSGSYSNAHTGPWQVGSLLYFPIILSVHKYELSIHQVSGPDLTEGCAPSKEDSLCKGPEVAMLAFPFLN